MSDSDTQDPDASVMAQPGSISDAPTESVIHRRERETAQHHSRQIASGQSSSDVAQNQQQQ